MRHNKRALVALLGFMGLAAVVLPAGAGAQKVANPGSFSLIAGGGQILIGSTMNVSLATGTEPECSDGEDNDFDGKVDLADPQCVAGPNGESASQDNSELAPGFQPKIDPSITGTIDAGGNMTIPTTGIVFPPSYVQLVHPVDGSKAIVKITILPTAAATGTLNANTGLMELNVKLRAKITGTLWGNSITGDCGIGTKNSPIAVRFTTDRLPAIGSNPSVGGSAYNPDNGRAMLVSNDFKVPGASGCTVNGGIVDISGQINDAVKLGSAAGKNMATLTGAIDPIIGAAVKAKIGHNGSTFTGSAPFAVGFTSTGSSVIKAPASYSWAFGDGATSSEANPTHTYANPGVYKPKLTVTDADGDSASVDVTVTVSGTPTSTTTTAAPTTTTTAAPTTTTTAAPTTTTTTVPTNPSTDDIVSVLISGSIKYDNTGSGTGDIRVHRDANGLASVSGSLEIPSSVSGKAKVSVNVSRVWMLPLWNGQVTVNDPGAKVNVTTPIIGQVGSTASPKTAKATNSWFKVGAFPNLVQPYTVSWSVTDVN